jgi:hypothetical protein
MMLPVLLALHSPVATAADCDGPAELATFSAATRDGERAFAEMDLPGLTTAREAALAVVPCLQAPIPVGVAADFHRLMALSAFTRGDEAQVLAEFHAARRLVPGYEVPEDVAPPGHPLMDLYAASRDADEGELQAAVPPEGGHVVVDGVRGALRPQGSSSLVQAFEPEDAWLETRFVDAGDPTPAWGPLPEELAADRRRHTLFGSLTGASALTAAGLYTFALIARSDFDNPDTPDRQLEPLRVRTNTLSVGAAATGAVAVGLGTALIVTW